MTPEQQIDLREKLAALCHEQWSGWMKYLFSKCEDITTSMDITRLPGWAVERWTRQMNTPYAELSEAEKDSDRKEADRFLAILDTALSSTPPAKEPAPQERPSEEK